MLRDSAVRSATGRTGRMEAPELCMRFHWPGGGPATGERDNFFLGAWHPTRPLRVEGAGPHGSALVRRKGPNWVLLSAASPVHEAGTGLVHQAADLREAVAFRGYVLPRLHSYSPGADILQYWRANPFAEHNGVFSAALIGRDGRTLTLISDALGIGPLYYRMLGELVLFSTNPRYLTSSEDRPDLVAWRCLVQTSWIVGNRSLAADVQRVPAGHALCLSASEPERVAWFDFGRLPGGERSLGPNAIGEVEDAFQQAVSRCLQLQAPGTVLPLSSGFDSRRILATLVKRGVEFEAVTSRGLQKGYRDLDARYAREMASGFGFSHTIVEPESVERYVSDDHARRLLVDAETAEHSWAIRVMAALPRRASLLFDGIGGDILGDPVGWSMHVGLRVEQRSAEADINLIADHAITRAFDGVLSRNRWPATAELREEVKSYLRPFLPRENIAELAFLLLRQRRTIALWSQQLLPPGHVAVCPYLELDYLRLLLTFRSTDKHATKLQRACLRQFWPEFYKYPGNRDIPPDLPAGSPALEHQRIAACHATLRREIAARDGMPLLRDLFSLRGRIGLARAKGSRDVLLRSNWYLNPVMELVSRQLSPGVWSP